MPRRRNALRMILLIAVALAMAAVLTTVICRKVFVVRNVVIEGNADASYEEIVRASKIELGTRISKVDEAAIRNNLESTGLYALEDMQIRRPNTVVLTIRQRTRDVVILHGGQYLTLDSEGVVICVTASMPEGDATYVCGLDETSYQIGKKITAPQARLTAMCTVLESLRANNAQQYVSDLNVQDTQHLMITTRSGIRVELGDLENMDSKIAWMCSAVADLESRGTLKGTLDVSSGTKADFAP